jgi:hypothetical protein
MVSRRASCRLCDCADLELILAFPLSPLADRYATDPYVTSIKYSQDVYICQACGHVQLLDIIPPSELFGDSYTYKPSNNGDLSAHWIEYADSLTSLLGRVPQKVLDIGSNDGSLLRALADRGAEICVGVEPVGSLTSN